MTLNPLYFLEIVLGLKIILSNQTIYSKPEIEAPDRRR